MPASHAWLQALIYEGKELDDPYFSNPARVFLDCLSPLVVANYAQAVWDFKHHQPTFREFLLAKR